MLYTYQHNGTTYTVNLERQPDGTYRATVGDGTTHEYHFSAQPTAHGWQIVTDAGRVTAYTAAQGDKRFVSVNGNTFELNIPDERAVRKKRSGTGDHDAALTAQMPGQVRALLVAQGDSVTRGQTLLVLEAMKMEIRVAAPNDGKISRVNVQQGEVVERGQVLVEIE